MRSRRDVIKHFWKLEVQNEMFNPEKPGTPAYQDRVDYINRLSTLDDKNRDGVIEKWLSYLKSENLTEFQVWRMHIMKRQFSVHQMIALKVIMQERRMQDVKSLSWRDGNGNYATKISKYGTLINKIYPLLDPDIATNEQRMARHANWFKETSTSSVFMTGNDWENNE